MAEVTAATAAAAAAASERESSRLWLLVWAPPVRLERGSWSEGSTSFYSVQGDTWAGPGCLQYRYKVFLFPILFCITHSSGSNFLKKKKLRCQRRNWNLVSLEIVYCISSISNCSLFDVFYTEFDHSSYSIFCAKYYFLLLWVVLSIQGLK